MSRAKTVGEFEVILRQWQMNGTGDNPRTYLPVWCPHCGTHIYAEKGIFVCPICHGQAELSFDDTVGLKVVKV